MVEHYAKSPTSRSSCDMLRSPKSGIASSIIISFLFSALLRLMCDPGYLVLMHQTVKGLIISSPVYLKLNLKVTWLKHNITVVVSICVMQGICIPVEISLRFSETLY